MDNGLKVLWAERECILKMSCTQLSSGTLQEAIDGMHGSAFRLNAFYVLGVVSYCSVCLHQLPA